MTEPFFRARQYGPVNVRIRGVDLPGRRFDGGQGDGCAYEEVMVGVQRGRAIEQLAPGDADSVVFEVELRPRGDRDAVGPYAHGRPGERFLYLCWVAGPDREMFRRAKVMLGDVPADLWHEALVAGRVLEGTVALTDARGGPLCARVGADAVTWAVVLENH